MIAEIRLGIRLWNRLKDSEDREEVIAELNRALDGDESTNPAGWAKLGKALGVFKKG